MYRFSTIICDKVVENREGYNKHRLQEMENETRNFKTSVKTDLTIRKKCNRIRISKATLFCFYHSTFNQNILII